MRLPKASCAVLTFLLFWANITLPISLFKKKQISCAKAISLRCNKKMILTGVVGLAVLFFSLYILKKLIYNSKDTGNNSGSPKKKNNALIKDTTLKKEDEVQKEKKDLEKKKKIEIKDKKEEKQEQIDIQGKQEIEKIKREQMEVVIKQKTKEIVKRKKEEKKDKEQKPNEKCTSLKNLYSGRIKKNEHKEVRRKRKNVYLNGEYYDLDFKDDTTTVQRKIKNQRVQSWGSFKL